MNALLVRCYGWLLRFYPRRFRAEFADEMQVVFAEIVRDNAKSGSGALLNVCLRELRDSPIAILREQFRERRAHMEAQTQLPLKPGAWREFLLATVPFGLFGLIFFLNLLQPLPGWVLSGLLWTLLLVPILFLVGLFKGLPRWSLPYVGMLAGALNLPLSLSWLRLQDVLPRLDSQLLADFYIKGSALVGLIALTILFVAVTAIFKPLRPLHERLREDWSLLSFALYGVTPLALFMAFDDFLFEEPYELGAFVAMVAGAWLYLRTPRPGPKMLVLFAGVTVVMVIVWIGRWMIAPDQPWAANGNGRDAGQALGGAFSTAAILWAWLTVIIIGVPALLSLFFRSRDPLAESQ